RPVRNPDRGQFRPGAGLAPDRRRLRLPEPEHKPRQAARRVADDRRRTHRPGGDDLPARRADHRPPDDPRHHRRGAGQRRRRARVCPKPGWVEHDPLEIWSAQISVAVEPLGRAGITAKDVAAVGITNQRETAVIWDRETGQPVGNAIVWQDRRTAPFCDRLRADGHEALVRDRTGLVIDAYFSGTKVNWI